MGRPHAKAAKPGDRRSLQPADSFMRIRWDNLHLPRETGEGETNGPSEIVVSCQKCVVAVFEIAVAPLEIAPVSFVFRISPFICRNRANE